MSGAAAPARVRAWRSPLYLRLLLGFCGANVVVMAATMLLMDNFVRRNYPVEPDWATLAEAADAAYEQGGREELVRWIEARHREGLEATLFEDGVPLVERPLPPPVMEILPQLLIENSIVLRPRPDLRLVGQRVTGHDGHVRQLVALRGPHPPRPRLEAFVHLQMLLSLIAIGLVGWWIARGVARPVAALRDATQRMAAGELSARVGPRWSGARDEIGQLAQDFDRMAARIEALVAHERSVLQDLSHELRSPLARLNLILDLAQHAPAEQAEPQFRRAEEEIARLDRLIGEMLALSRMEADLPGMKRERVPLAEHVRSRVEAAQVEAQARGIALGFTDASEGAAVEGVPLLIERALDNVLANAIKFAPAGSAVETALNASGSEAEITIRDHGPGVPPAEIESLFRPFFRGANAPRAEGHGLGLAIVQRIVQAHRGRATAENAEGGGLRVRLHLPLA